MYLNLFFSVEQEKNRCRVFYTLFFPLCLNRYILLSVAIISNADLLCLFIPKHFYNNLVIFASYSGYIASA